MDINLKRYGNEELVWHVQKTLKQWKQAEKYYENRDTEKNGTCIVETLKKRYILLLMEVRKRNLSLTSKQLLEAIILKISSKRE